MSEAQVRNVLWYAAYALAGALVATGLHLGTVLNGDAPVTVRPFLATFLLTLCGTLATALGTAFRPKAGREDISGLVSEVGPTAAKAALEDEAVKQATGEPSALPDAHVAQIVAAVKAEMLATRAEELRHEFPDGEPADPALISKPPAWVPGGRS